ncbi:ATPase, T2SS/T4P/T4SS family [Rahnella perminowiae]|uniref:ATPase, T2SS/T4P/T4SS family n=1 Tax=Rahnella perminowiae TaxID=2816244 RepID=UPI00215D34B0|nr:ATPase, T2SS/T4P/T4SS family [Rahnella perminowiae]MCR8998643.1 ATPase, T2SS/T4P/T4SS family [Rahnella perminowiae]MCR8998703.1 ATPase, T2SS/T4P/T4SS family [Rahnella perminowiae]
MDPDRLYIGEIRDADSAIATIEGILTGVPAVTTTHTNTPVDILQRLRKFGIELDLLFDPTIISGLVGLRLVPLLCPECRVPWHEGRESVSPYMRDLVETYAGSEGIYLRNPGDVPIAAKVVSRAEPAFLRSLKPTTNLCACMPIKGN